MTTMSMGRAVSWWADRAPDAVAVRCGDAVLTRRELDVRSDGLARRWIADGIRVDDVVTVQLPNSLDAVLAFVAAWKAGATPQPLSPGLDPTERRAVLDLTRPARVVAEPFGPDDELAGPPLPELAASSWKAPTSSGSTGTPKIVRAADPARFDPQGRVAPFVPRRAVQLVAGPLSHAAPFVYAARGLVTGHELVVMPRFDAGEWLRLVAGHRVTWGMVVPAMMHAVHHHPARATADVSSLESVLHLGARCAPWLKRSWIDWLGPERVHELYAGTESQGLAFVDGVEWSQRPGTVGRALAGSQFRVVRPDLTDCAPDEVGEILMRRANPTYAYVGAEPVVRDGWHTLGDAGRLDADGYLFVSDRLADLIDVGGRSVAPSDVEGVLEEHPAVRSAVAVPGDDGRVRAVVDAPAGAPTEDLDVWCADRLAPHERPGSYTFVAAPLRDDTGKVRRSRWRPGDSGRTSCDDYDR